jgi:hypothetical protein
MTRRHTLAALAFFLVVALAATYPLLRHPTRTIAGGLADPIILTTVLAWDADRFLHGLRGLWDPPFFFPHRWALAYSEHMLGVAIFTAPSNGWLGIRCSPTTWRTSDPTCWRASGCFC